MKTRSLLVHILLSGALVLLLFGKLIPNLNHIYFSQSGDGFRTYFGIWYHAKYDTTNYRLDGMNYPFGEMIGFTDCQPPVANTIRSISKNITDITQYTTGIINGLMLFSIFLASIFLFLILRRMKLPAWYASIVALGITFLSPQIMRIGGHFSLGWVFWIPLSIYLLMVFDTKRSYIFSALICLFATLSGDTHFYFLAFWVFLFGLYWVYRWIWRSNYKFDKSDLLHFFIQVLLPVAILQLNLIINDPVTDRTANPWGFYTFRGHFPTVFFPLNKPYIPLSNKLGLGFHYEWEAFCYIGVVASAGFFALLFHWIRTLIKKKKASSITGDRFNDFLLCSSFLVLLFSFGMPFTLGLDKLRHLTGPLGQLRGVARFGWLFFYVINLVVFRNIYFTFFKSKEKQIGKRILVFGCLCLLLFEAWQSSGRYQNLLNNTIEELDGKNGTLREFCQTNINPEEYQAVLPLPYFHIGSESIWLEQECDMMKKSFIVSLETGLPNIGMMAARTSLSQTYENIALVKTPWKEYNVVDKYRNNKALLLTVGNCDKLNSDEKRLVDHATFKGESFDVKFYQLSLDSLKAIPLEYNFPAKYKALIDSVAALSDTSINSAYLVQTGNRTKRGNEQQGILLTEDFQRIMEAPVQFDVNQKCYLRFWVKDYNHDLVARTQLLVIQSSPTHETLDEMYTDIFRNYKTFDGNWALIEIPLAPKQENEIIKLLIKNKDLKGERLFFNEFSVSSQALL